MPSFPLTLKKSLNLFIFEATCLVRKQAMSYYGTTRANWNCLRLNKLLQANYFWHTVLNIADTSLSLSTAPSSIYIKKQILMKQQQHILIQ